MPGAKFSMPGQVNGRTPEYSACLCRYYALGFDIYTTVYTHLDEETISTVFFDGAWRYWLCVIIISNFDR